MSKEYFVRAYENVDNSVVKSSSGKLCTIVSMQTYVPVILEGTLFRNGDKFNIVKLKNTPSKYKDDKFLVKDDSLYFLDRDKNQFWISSVA